MSEETPKPKLSITAMQRRFDKARELVKIAKTSGAFGGKSVSERKRSKEARESKYLFTK